MSDEDPGMIILDDLDGDLTFSSSNVSLNSLDMSNSSDSNDELTEVRRSARKRKLKGQNIKCSFIVGQQANVNWFKE